MPICLISYEYILKLCVIRSSYPIYILFKLLLEHIVVSMEQKNNLRLISTVRKSRHFGTVWNLIKINLIKKKLPKYRL